MLIHHFLHYYNPRCRQMVSKRGRCDQPWSHILSIVKVKTEIFLKQSCGPPTITLTIESRMVCKFQTRNPISFVVCAYLHGLAWFTCSVVEDEASWSWLGTSAPIRVEMDVGLILRNCHLDVLPKPSKLLLHSILMAHCNIIQVIVGEGNRFKVEGNELRTRHDNLPFAALARGVHLQADSTEEQAFLDGSLAFMQDHGVGSTIFCMTLQKCNLLNLLCHVDRIQLPHYRSLLSREDDGTGRTRTHAYNFQGSLTQ